MTTCDSRLTSCVEAAKGVRKSLARIVLEDAGPLKGLIPNSEEGADRKRWGDAFAILGRLGVDYGRGDRGFLQDLNETSLDDLVDSGATLQVAVRIKQASLSRAALARSTRYDRQQEHLLEHGSALDKILARARLLRFLYPLRRLGVQHASELADVTAADLDQLEMRTLPRRRFRAVLAAGLPTYPENKRKFQHHDKTFMTGHTANVLLQKVRFTKFQIKKLDEDHGVEILGDLWQVTDDMLHDINARTLHVRRFRNNLVNVSRPHMEPLRPRCNDLHTAVLEAARLGRWAAAFRERLGVERACHLVCTERMPCSSQPPSHEPKPLMRAKLPLASREHS